MDVDPRSGVPTYVQIVDQVRHALDVMGTPILEENGSEDFKGIDIMRSVRSFDPCLPCGVHVWTAVLSVSKARTSAATGDQGGF